MRKNLTVLTQCFHLQGIICMYLSLFNESWLLKLNSSTDLGHSASVFKRVGYLSCYLCGKYLFPLRRISRFKAEMLLFQNLGWKPDCLILVPNLELLDATHLPQGWGCHPPHLTSLSCPRHKWIRTHIGKLDTSFPPLIRRDFWRLQKTAQTARYLPVSLRCAKQVGYSGIQHV